MTSLICLEMAELSTTYMMPRALPRSKTFITNVVCTYVNVFLAESHVREEASQIKREAAREAAMRQCPDGRSSM